MYEYENIIHKCFLKKEVADFLCEHHERWWYKEAIITVILNSYTTIEEKLKMLLEVSNTTDSENLRNYAMLNHELYGKCWEWFKHPEQYGFYPYFYTFYEIVQDEYKLTDYSRDFICNIGNYKELLEFLEGYKYASNYCLSVELNFITPDQKIINFANCYYDAKNSNPYYLSIDNYEEIKQVTDIISKYHIDPDSTMIYQNYYVGFSCDCVPIHYQFPYKYDTYLKVQTPIMEKPVYGWLDGEMDGNGCWYYFLKDKNIKPDIYCSDILFDFSYHIFDYGSSGNYVCLDWIEPV